MKIVLSSCVCLFVFGMAFLACKSGGGESVVKEDAAVVVAQPNEAAAKGETTKLFIGPELAHCVGMAHRECNVVRTSAEEKWGFFFDAIEGFAPEVGTEYELLVEKIIVANPPADDSSFKYVLKNIVSEKSVLKAAVLPPDCAGKKVVIKPEIIKEPAQPGMNRTLNLSVTFCDGSTSSHKVDQTRSAWVFPWWVKGNVDWGAAAAGAVFTARTKIPDQHQATIRVVPKEGYLSIQRAVQAWVPKPAGPEGVGPMNFIEYKRIAIPAGATIELQQE